MLSCCEITKHKHNLIHGFTNQKSRVTMAVVCVTDNTNMKQSMGTRNISCSDNCNPLTFEEAKFRVNTMPEGALLINGRDGNSNRCRKCF